jgi:hypothetical protein
MAEYLFKVQIKFDGWYNGDKSPVYAVAESKEAVAKYVSEHLRTGVVDKVSLLGERLGMNMYHGKPKRQKKNNNVYQYNTQPTK